jgi:hypothetical protein
MSGATLEWRRYASDWETSALWEGQRLFEAMAIAERDNRQRMEGATS